MLRKYKYLLFINLFSFGPQAHYLLQMLPLPYVAILMKHNLDFPYIETPGSFYLYFPRDFFNLPWMNFKIR